MSGASNYDTESFFKENEPGVPNNQMDLQTLCSGVDKYGRKNWFLVTGGTSMSAPVVTGIVALWMQANPQLTAKEIREIMKTTSINDEWTTDIDKIPSHNKVQAGYGKIDCLAGLKKILGIPTGIETVGADGHREASPATMYSVDAPVYNIMGQRVDKSHKGLVIYKGRKYMNR
jgi:subtilisin family serine protease